MVSTFTPNKNIEQPAHNDAVNTWDVPVNADWSQIDKAFGNSTLKNATGLSGNINLAVADYVPLTLIISGAPAAAVTYVVPTGVGGQWVVANATTGGFTIGIKSNAGGTTIPIPAGTNTLVSCDGSATGMRLSINTPPPAGGATTQIQFNNSGVLGGAAGLTWDGTTVSMTGLAVNGNTLLGLNSGSTLTINGTAVSIPNNLNIDANTVFIDATNNRVGIGTITPGSPLTVAGTIESTAGGVKFPDGSIQTTAGVITGIVLDYIGTTAPAGWVFANGQTIGSAASGATGRANADTVALFTLLWNSWANAQAAVSGGRGANAAADFAANKTIALPDLRGRGVSGMDAFGGSADAGRIGNVTPGGTGGGSTNSAGVTVSSVSVSGNVVVNSGAVAVAASGTITSNSSPGVTGGGGVVCAVAGDSVSVTGNTAAITSNGGNTLTGSGSGTTATFSVVQPTMVMPKIIKL